MVAFLYRREGDLDWTGNSRARAHHMLLHTLGGEGNFRVGPLRVRDTRTLSLHDLGWIISTDWVADVCESWMVTWISINLWVPMKLVITAQPWPKQQNVFMVSSLRMAAKEYCLGNCFYSLSFMSDKVWLFKYKVEFSIWLTQFKDAG